MKLDKLIFDEGIYYADAKVKLDQNKQKKDWDEVAPHWAEKLKQVERSRPGGVWSRFPSGVHFNSVLDFGCGLGSHAAALSLHWGVTCQEYYAVDVSQQMLKFLQINKDRTNFFPAAKHYLICADSLDNFLTENSIDFVMSNSVFFHLNKGQLKRVMGQICRSLKPGGHFVFANSFFNGKNPAHFLTYFTKKIFEFFGAKHFTSIYTFEEISQLFRKAGFDEKGIRYTISPTQHTYVFPGMKNDLRNSFLKKMFNGGFDAYSDILKSKTVSK